MTPKTHNSGVSIKPFEPYSTNAGDIHCGPSVAGSEHFRVAVFGVAINKNKRKQLIQDLNSDESPGGVATPKTSIQSFNVDYLL